MVESWGLAFCIAALLALAGGSVLRRAARRHDAIVDFRRMGGIVLLASLVGWALRAARLGRAARPRGTTLLMAVIGVLADDGILRRRLLLAAILAASIVPVAAGVRFDVLGVPGPDAVISVLWIGGLTAAVAGLGNTEGLLGSVVGRRGVRRVLAGGVQLPRTRSRP